MKIPLSWLKQFIDVSLSPEEIAQTLTMAGIEVDKVSPLDLGFSQVVVAEILSILPHPNAEKLCIATLFDGVEKVEVVCGDLTCKVGQRTALAKIGAKLRDESGKMEAIKKGKLRGVESFGMLCSEKDLGLSESYEQILSLPVEVALGSDLAELFSDIIFDISLTPNLGHAQSIIGVARELAAMLNCKIKKLDAPHLEENPARAIEELVEVVIEDEESCPRYACRLIENVTVGPSPFSVKRWVEAAGLRSINNVVDIANLIMIESGQPFHLFDFDKIAGKKIIVTSQAKTAHLETLDNKNHPIPKGCLLISDSQKPLAFAGVIGSSESAVTESTKNILIEAAYFTPSAIRKTMKLLGLRTDAASRFEKGIDPTQVVFHLNRCAALLKQHAGGSIVRGTIDLIKAPFKAKNLFCRLERVNSILGTQLSLGEVSSLLERLEIVTTSQEEKGVHVKVPTYRNDIQSEIDLIEEVGRVFGFNHIAKSRTTHTSSTLIDAPIYSFENQVRERLVSEGLQECQTCDLISPTLAALSAGFSSDASMVISVMHPSSIDQSVLRPSLLPGLLEVVKLNINHQNPHLSLFEIGKIHFKDGTHIKEFSTASLVLTGNATPHQIEPKTREADFFDLKGMVENLFLFFHLLPVTFEASHYHNFHPGRQAKVKVGPLTVGVIGEVHPLKLRELDIEQRVYFAELNVSELLHLAKKELRVRPLPLFPGSERDWTLTLKEEQPIEEILSSVRALASPLLEKVILLDLYKSDQIGKDRKNATLRLFYRDNAKTLSLEDVEREHAKITQEIIKKLG